MANIGLFILLLVVASSSLYFCLLLSVWETSSFSWNLCAYLDFFWPFARTSSRAPAVELRAFQGQISPARSNKRPRSPVLSSMLFSGSLRFSQTVRMLNDNGKLDTRTRLLVSTVKHRLPPGFFQGVLLSLQVNNSP